MPLTQCRECHKDVSRDASKCPHCGVHNPSKQKNRLVNALLFVFFGVPVILFFVVIIIAPGDSAPPSIQSDIPHSSQLDSPPTVNWEEYPSEIKSGIDESFEFRDCDTLKILFDMAFELQQNEYGHAPLVVYIVDRREKAGCQK